MVRRLLAASWVILAATSLGGCSQAVGLYHSAEGGAIAQSRQPPPGANLPYPNLADVPPPQPPAAQGAQAAITAQARGGVFAPAPGELAGLSLPTTAPPVPDVPGVSITNPPVNAVAAPVPVVTPLTKPASAKPPTLPPVAVAFAPGSALLTYQQGLLVRGAAARRGDAHVRVVGFGDGSMDLALARARRLADALTAAGVPGADIEISALADGSGGIVQP